MKMLYLALLFLEAHLIVSNGIDVLGSKSLRDDEIEALVSSSCPGKIGECLWATKAEEEMDSEANRRVLMMQKRYISYDSLKLDTVPCPRLGSSYYNCPPMGKVNPYNRGCEVITGCARDIRDIKS
uniref:Protein RALF-like 24 n=1 Tax=Nelumbo nucifera TaxID=4432 RepID=A0A822Z0X7_NELNU|nr:TPA_asm: hypothetical protein HUJ06_007766 [Nelumbo nucifera]